MGGVRMFCLLRFVFLNLMLSEYVFVFCSLEVKGSGRLKDCKDPNVSQTEPNVTERSKIFIENCRREVAMNIEIKRSGNVGNKTKLVMVNHLFDEAVNSEVTLLYPLVVRIRQNHLLWNYPFKHLVSVNNKPYEAVYRHEFIDSMQKHCDTNGIASTACKDESRQDSNQPGFCCLCSRKHNSSQSHLMSAGPDCDGKQPHYSIHCLRFDPLWYSVNIIEEQVLEDSLNIGIYLESEIVGENTKWIGVTGHEEINLQSRKNVFKASNQKVYASYNHISTIKAEGPLNGTNEYLLIPEPITVANAGEVHKQIKGGPGEFLILNKKLVETSGTECGKVGVKHAAFINQTDKCKLPSERCMAYQPADFWTEDSVIISFINHGNLNYDLCIMTQAAYFPNLKKRSDPRKNKYFLSSHGKLTDHPFTWTHEGVKEKSIQLMYEEMLIGNLNLEINADKLTLLHPGSHGVIVEASSWSRTNDTSVLVHIDNRGLVSELFTVLLHTCTDDPMKKKSIVLKLAPHQSNIVKFTIDPLKKNTSKILCAVDLRNHNEKVVAYRQVTIKILDRCYCVAMCQCKCMTDESFGCTAMTQDSYNQAGFRNQLPSLTLTSLVKPSAALTLEIIFIIILSFLLIGITKMIIGIYISVPIGQFGLSLCRDPETRGPKGREMTVLREAVLNLFFVFYVFFIPLHLVVRKAGMDSYKKKIKSIGTKSLMAVRKKTDACLNSVRHRASKPKSTEDASVKKCSSQPEMSPLLNKNSSKKEKSLPCQRSVQLEVSQAERGSEESEAQKSRESLDRHAAIQQFRRQKRFLKQLSRRIRGGSKSVDVSSTNSAQSSQEGPSGGSSRAMSETKAIESAVFHILTSEQKSFIERVTKGGVRIFLKFNKPDIHLRRSGDNFSLCGHVRQIDSSFKFMLGPHLIQLYELVQGEVQLLRTPLPINPKFFQRTLNMTEMLTLISEEPVYPCLNLARTP